MVDGSLPYKGRVVISLQDDVHIIKNDPSVHSHDPAIVDHENELIVVILSHLKLYEMPQSIVWQLVEYICQGPSAKNKSESERVI